ncbi:cytochrome P450 4c3-like isoform X2 [Culicoides brevitarsis]|uniref:cytochrome P450 4c3-like isoform X2 n=1 Tax=Culicoides brevitarsis TaxID=469753 RepID=UPI00307B5FA7
MFLLLITVLLTSILASLIFRKIQKNSFDRDVTRIKGPLGYPLVGNGLEFILPDSVETFKKIIWYAQTWNYRLRAYAAWHRFVLVALPEDIEVIMTDQRFLEKSHDYNVLHKWLQDGLLTVSKKPKWQTRRKILTPAFHFSILEDFVQVMNQQATILTKILQKHVNDDGFDIVPYISLYTMDVICETSMGTKVNAQTDVNSSYVKAVVEVSSILFWRMHHFLARDDWYWRWTPQKKRHDQLVQLIHDHTEKIIETRREEKLKMRKKSIESEDIGIKKRTALLDILLDSTVNGQKLSNMDILEETDNFMFAGHDTTTSAINFLLYNLAKHQDVQQKLYEEIVDVLGTDKDASYTVNDLSNFKYFEMVLKESLRLYTPVPIIGRYLREDVEINGVVYPKDHNILLGLYMMHRNPNVFPEPEKFIPERFSEQRSHEKKNAFSYVPFSGGYRNCIGQRFAQLEIKLVTARILQNFHLELADPNFEPILTAELILKPVNGIVVKLKPRN